MYTCDIVYIFFISSSLRNAHLSTEHNGAYLYQKCLIYQSGAYTIFSPYDFLFAHTLPSLYPKDASGLMTSFDLQMFSRLNKGQIFP